MPKFTQVDADLLSPGAAGLLQRLRAIDLSDPHAVTQVLEVLRSSPSAGLTAYENNAVARDANYVTRELAQKLRAMTKRHFEELPAD